MAYLKNLLIAVLAEALVLGPVLFLLRDILFRSPRKAPLYFCLGLYLTAVYTLVGFPTLPYVKYLSFQPNINWIPLSGLAKDLPNILMNIVLFLPLGFLLPLCQRDFRNGKSTLGFGFRLSLGIECMQLFLGRATDINDLLANTLGTLLGYLLARVFLPASGATARGKTDVLTLNATTLLTLFLLQPYPAATLEKIL